MRHTIKLRVKSALAKAGYEVRRVPPVRSRVSGTAHSRVSPHATYSPWLTDAEFRDVYDIVQPHTLVDQYRCYELWALVGEASKVAGGDVIEVGVWRGGSGCLMARRCQLLGIPAEVHLCENFEGMVKTSQVDGEFVGGELADTSDMAVAKLASRCHLTNVRIWKGIFPEETGRFLERQRFRLCHIDVGVYQSAKDAFAWLWGRVVVGGVVVFDDYGFADSVGITRLVEEERGKRDRLVVHNLNGHAVIVKIA
jgi:O-methyltransferase